MNSAVLTPEVRIFAAFPALLCADGLGELQTDGAAEATNPLSSGNVGVTSHHILEAFGQYGGDLISKLSDGFLVYFERADRAIACATNIQTTLADRAALFPEDDVFPPRIGVFMGDLQLESATSDWFTQGYESSIAVNLANDASPGGIVLARVVYDVVNCCLTLRSTHLDSQDLRSIDKVSDAFESMMEALAKQDAIVSTFDTSSYQSHQTIKAAPSALNPASDPTVGEQTFPERVPAEPVSAAQAFMDAAEPEPSLGDIFTPDLARSDGESISEGLLPEWSEEPQQVMPTQFDTTRSSHKAEFSLSEFRREQLLASLAEHVGPIASLTMSQAEESASSSQELVSLLLEVVPKRNRSAFRIVAFNILTQDSAEPEDISSSRPWEIL